MKPIVSKSIKPILLKVLVDSKSSSPRIHDSKFGLMAEGSTFQLYVSAHGREGSVLDVSGSDDVEVVLRVNFRPDNMESSLITRVDDLDIGPFLGLAVRNH